MLRVLSLNALSICTEANRIDTLTLTATAGYDEGATIAVLDQSPGLATSFASLNISTGEEVEIYVEVTAEFQGLTGFVNLIVENDLGPSEFSITVDVFASTPDVVTLISPNDNSSGLDFDINFEWTNTAPFFLIEVAEVPDFSTTTRIIDNLNSNTITLKDFVQQQLISGV